MSYEDFGDELYEERRLRRYMEYLFKEGVVVITGYDSSGDAIYRAKTDEEIQAEIYEILNS